MNIQSYTTKTGKKGYILKGAYIGIDTLTGEQVRANLRGKTKKEVQLKFQNKIREFEENGYTTKKEASIKTYNDLIDAWLVYYEKTVKSGTYYTTYSVLDKYVRPLIGKHKLDKMTPALIQNKINEFINNESQKRQDYKSILSLMKRIFKYGVSLELLKTNPMERTLIHSVKRETPAPKEIKYYDKNEFNLFVAKLNHLSFDEWKSSIISTYLRLLAFTGMRSRECLALEWSDIDFKARTVTINKTLNRFDELELTPKTDSSIRTIELDTDTLNILNNWKKTQTEKSWELGIKPTQFIFYNFLKEKYYGYMYVSKAYRDICSEINIPNIGLHGLRHTHATLYVNAGVDYKVIQERLGHENISMTMNIYAHALAETKRNSLDNVLSFISNA